MEGSRGAGRTVAAAQALAWVCAWTEGAVARGLVQARHLAYARPGTDPWRLRAVRDNTGGVMTTAVQPRSTFVTVVAWIFIAFSAPAVLIALLQNLMFQLMFKRPEVEAAWQQASDMPVWAGWILHGFQWFFLAFLLVAITMLVSSIGLLRRRNWARLIFLGLLGLGVAWQLLGIVAQCVMWPFMHAQMVAAQLPPDAPPMGAIMWVFAVVCGLFALAQIGLLGWIGWRLTRPAVAAEFRAVQSL